MSLLIQDYDEHLVTFARAVFDEQMASDPRLVKEYDDRRQRLMFNDILYNLGYLETAIRFEDHKVFAHYVVWLYQLMDALMKDLSSERVKQQLVDHLNIVDRSLDQIYDAAGSHIAHQVIGEAIKALDTEQYPDSEMSDADNPHAAIRDAYLIRLMSSDTRGAFQVIQNAVDEGVVLEDIFINVIQDAMHLVGDWWHQGTISVAKEHYATSTTQMVLSQFYSNIFGTPRNGHTVVACSVGTELHEMGIRMVSDLLEYHGWDSVYLGTAVPTPSILAAIEDNKPDFVALSVTMPQHLATCYEVVQAIQDKYPDVLITVGGRAFQTTDDLWQKWGVAFSANDASELVEWANVTFVRKDHHAL